MLIHNNVCGVVLGENLFLLPSKFSPRCYHPDLSMCLKATPVRWFILGFVGGHSGSSVGGNALGWGFPMDWADYSDNFCEVHLLWKHLFIQATLFRKDSLNYYGEP